MKSATPLTPATISPKLIFEVSNRVLSSGGLSAPGSATLTCRLGWTHHARYTAWPTHRGRSAGSDAERRAAVHLQGRLRALGRDAEIAGDRGPARATASPTRSTGCSRSPAAWSPSAKPRGGARAGGRRGRLGVARRRRRRCTCVRRLTGRRASQNVDVARGWRQARRAGARGALRRGPRRAPRSRASRALLRDPWAGAARRRSLLVLACCVAPRRGGRGAGADGGPVRARRCFLILLTPLLVDLELAAAARSARPTTRAAWRPCSASPSDAGGELEHFDLWVLLTGAAKPFGLGMGRWLRRHRARSSTTSARCSSRSPPSATGRCATPAARARLPPAHPLAARRGCAREIAEDAGADGPLARSRAAQPGDAAAAIARGFPAISRVERGHGTDGAALDRAYAFTRELLPRLDAEVGRRSRAAPPRSSARTLPERAGEHRAQTGVTALCFAGHSRERPRRSAKRRRARRAGPRAGSPRRPPAPRPGGGCRSPPCTRARSFSTNASRSASSSIAWTWL